MSERIPPSSDRLRRMASDLESEVSEARSEQLAARAIARGRVQYRRHRRHVAVVVGAASLIFVLVGLGYGSSKSLPGDPLYGVSRAYEGVGQLVGVVNPLEQRLHEVIALAERGDRVRAVQVASEALEEFGRAANIALVSTATSTTTSTTTPEVQDTAAPAVGPDDTTDPPDTAATPETTEAPLTAESDQTDTEGESEEVTEEDPIENLKVAAQLLLNRVREDGGELDAAAADDLAVAVSALTEEEEEESVNEEDEPETTSTSTTSSTTTTTEPDESATSTTEPESTTSSTSTTIPGDEPADGEDTGEDDGPGPIFIPPEF